MWNSLAIPLVSLLHSKSCIQIKKSLYSIFMFMTKCEEFFLIFFFFIIIHTILLAPFIFKQKKSIHFMQILNIDHSPNCSELHCYCFVDATEFSIEIGALFVAMQIAEWIMIIKSIDSNKNSKLNSIFRLQFELVVANTIFFLHIKQPGNVSRTKTGELLWHRYDSFWMFFFSTKHIHTLKMKSTTAWLF